MQPALDHHIHSQSSQNLPSPPTDRNLSHVFKALTSTLAALSTLYYSRLHQPFVGIERMNCRSPRPGAEYIVCTSESSQSSSILL